MKVLELKSNARNPWQSQNLPNDFQAYHDDHAAARTTVDTSLSHCYTDSSASDVSPLKDIFLCIDAQIPHVM